jgi:uncharacterized protein YjbI with pentapeptide repeats
MSETIHTTIYNDNIQSTSSINTQLYTNKLNGTIILGNSNVNVSISNLSTTNLNVTNLTSTNISVTNLRAINISTNNLSTTNLSVTNLSAANLSVTNLSTINLSVINLNVTNLSVSNISTTNLSVRNLTSINISTPILSIDNLSVNNISYIQETGTNYYLNNTNSIIQQNIPTTSTTVNHSLNTTMDGYSAKSFNILGSTLKEFNNSLITLTLFCSVTPASDFIGKTQFTFTITSLTNSGGIVYASSLVSDDINHISASTLLPFTCQMNLSSDTINSLTDSTIYFLNIKVLTSVSSTTKFLRVSYDTTSNVSTINILKLINIGYTNTITNNWPYAQGSGVQDTFTMTTSEQDFGNPMVLSKGIWSITMYTSIVSSAATTYSYFNIIYKLQASPFTEYDNTNYYYYLHTAGTYPITINTVLVIPSTVNISPRIKTLVASGAGVTNVLKNTYGSGFKIMRIA